MKVIRSSSEEFRFYLGKREQKLLLDLLTRYPCVPSEHHRITQSGKLSDAANIQVLLDEALAEQRSENKKQLEALLSHPERFKSDGHGWLLSLTPAELEWLIQILNDIRVGSWVQVGSPDPMPGSIDPTTAPHLWAMELSGYFQMHLLEALNGTGES